MSNKTAALNGSNTKMRAYLEKKLVSGQRVLMTHVVMGYPTLSDSLALILAMAEAGVDMIEVQLPFSDPVADGPAIMTANQVAVEQGVDVERSLQALAQASQQVGIPLLIMCYFHSIFHYGVAAFCHRAAEAGIKGLIVPDLPPEEDKLEGLHVACQREGLDLIRVVSPGMSRQRLQLVLKGASGFVYCTARSGITGLASQMQAELFAFTNLIKKISGLPVGVGFGIRDRDQVNLVTKHGCIAVIGSALLEMYMEVTDITAVAARIQVLKQSTERRSYVRSR